VSELASSPFNTAAPRSADRACELTVRHGIAESETDERQCGGLVIDLPDDDPFDTAALRAGVLAAWGDSPTRFREDANAEEDLRLGGYADTWFVELAQNAADAAVHGGRLRVELVKDAPAVSGREAEAAASSLGAGATGATAEAGAGWVGGAAGAGSAGVAAERIGAAMRGADS